MRLSSRQWIVVERIHSSCQLIAFLELVYIILSNIKCQRVMNFSKLHFFDIKVLTLCHGFFMWFLATDAWLMFCYKILYFDFMWNQWSSRQFSFWIYTVFFLFRVSLNGLSEWANMRMQVDLCPLLDVVNGMHFRFFDTIHKFPNGLWALCRSILSQQSNVPTTAHTHNHYRLGTEYIF